MSSDEVHATSVVPMANQIAAAFAPLDDARAEAAIAGHITQFWEKRMWAAILAHLAAGGEGLEPRVRRALRQLTEAAQP